MKPARKFICAHDVRWPLLFEAEKRTLQLSSGGVLVALHHIGSTAVPGLAAKPIIDILAEARSLEEVDAQAHAFESCGYEARGPYGIEGRRYFSKPWSGADKVGFHLHIYASRLAADGAPRSVS